VGHEAFLRLALRQHRPEIVQAVARFSFLRRAHLELPIAGVPGISLVEIFAWPNPIGRARRVLADIVATDRQALSEPVTVEIELQDGEAAPLRTETAPVVVDARTRLAAEEDAVQIGACLWRRVGPGKQQEVFQLQLDGTPLVRTIDTTKYPYRLTCSCGRVRYAKRNSLHQIHACRVCTEFARTRAKALKQFRARRGLS
jgi:hypothetical protein